MENNNQTKKPSYTLISGSHEAQGPRRTMEDTHKRIDDIKAEGFNITNFSQAAYYGVYDGHGGAQTAEMVVDSLHSKIFANELFASGDIDGAINKGFQEMDQYVVEEANKQNTMHGCTCVCSLVLDGKVYFANIGDSEGILISVENGTVTAKSMTKAHKASDPVEKERIESLGGHVFFGRVYGSLAVSRSFGDAKYKRPKTSKDFVSWEPYTETQILTPNHKYMVLACDGLFDVMTHQDVADMTHKLFEVGNNAASVAKSLVVRAVKDLQTEDNVTVIVVKINWDTDGTEQTPEQSTATSSNPTSEVVIQTDQPHSEKSHHEEPPEQPPQEQPHSEKPHHEEPHPEKSHHEEPHHEQPHHEQPHHEQPHHEPHNEHPQHEQSHCEQQLHSEKPHPEEPHHEQPHHEQSHHEHTTEQPHHEHTTEHPVTEQAKEQLQSTTMECTTESTKETEKGSDVTSNNSL